MTGERKMISSLLHSEHQEAKWKRWLLTHSVAMVPCVVNSLDYLDEYINVEQSVLVRRE